MRQVRVRLGAREGYDIRIGAGALGLLGETARGVLSPRARRVALVSNARVYDLYGDRASASLRAAGYAVEPWLAGEGERHKTLRTAAGALDFFTGRGLERTDAVVALGGGVVGDLAGFAAALYLRGVDFVQVPTTLLAQIDASVGGKTGVNTRAGKNLIGVFHQPRAVLVDTDTLRTLPPRELTAGFCEAVKHGAVGGRQLFSRTRDFLAARAAGGRARRGDDEGGDALANLIADHCAFKARIVAGDEREAVGRADARSRRVLNFGHTVGHALEALTRYRRFRHGEAVGHGMIVAAEISNRLGLLDGSGLESLRGAIALAGPLPRADDLDPAEILRAAASDKKSAGGEINWVLLEGIGRARVVAGREVSRRVLLASLKAGLGRRRAVSASGRG
ncbi:MAG: 3-dehydroquinate synthase [Acidobacteria bacterium]|nr:3-dehydroquinate synthase [Acidobacteriota bacterium]